MQVWNSPFSRSKPVLARRTSKNDSALESVSPATERPLCQMRTSSRPYWPSKLILTCIYVQSTWSIRKFAETVLEVDLSESATPQTHEVPACTMMSAPGFFCSLS
eukprot:6203445-Amphidinium_carterae.1